MPYVPSRMAGDVPDGPHLALVKGTQDGIAIPIGANFLHVMDPKDPSAIQRLILVKVEQEAWVFRCACNPKCQQVVRMMFVRKGLHNLPK